jgi:hypothetical protein
MKYFLAYIFLAFCVTGCATSGSTTLTTPTGSLAVPTATLNTGYTVANILQEFNTGLTASLPTVNQVLTATHNTGDAGIVNDVVVGTNLVSALVSAFTSTVKASQASGASAAQTQAAASAVLAPANVATIAANVVSTSPTH